MGKEDIRILILRELDKKNRSTAEYRLNEYLATLHDDLGTIRRSLIELQEEGLIANSYNYNIKNLLITTEKDYKMYHNVHDMHESYLKKSRRLIEDPEVTRYGIQGLYFYICLKGKTFIFENSKSKRDSLLGKFRISIFWIAFIFSAYTILSKANSDIDLFKLFNQESPK
jgi:hypothetical protein